MSGSSNNGSVTFNTFTVNATFVCPYCNKSHTFDLHRGQDGISTASWDGDCECGSYLSLGDPATLEIGVNSVRFSHDYY